MPSTVPCDTGGEAQSAAGVASSSAGHPSPASNGHAADSPPPSLPAQPPATTPNGTSAAAAGGGAVCAGAAAFLPSPPAALNGTAGVNSGGSAALWDADSMWILMYDNMLREGTRSSPTKRSCGCKGRRWVCVVVGNLPAFCFVFFLSTRTSVFEVANRSRCRYRFRNKKTICACGSKTALRNVFSDRTA